MDRVLLMKIIPMGWHIGDIYYGTALLVQTIHHDNNNSGRVAQCLGNKSPNKIHLV